MNLVDFFKKRKTYFISLFVIILFSAGFYFWQNYGWRRGIDFSCINIEEHNVTGKSLEPLFLDGTKVRGLAGYYDCNEIKRGEVVIIKFKTREETFVKKIIGLPGDELVFIEGNQAKLNGEILKNSIGEPYLFSKASQKIITIPLKDDKIQEGRHFILSDEKGPSAFDSRQFGFVSKEHLIGRMIK